MLSILVLAAFARAGDWPCYRGDDARSATTSEELAFPLSPAWVHTTQPARPAWPDPLKEAYVLDFDRAGARRHRRAGPVRVLGR